jgi:hypothetical protein
MKKVKLNDYCEFPMTLDMYPYTSVGLYEKEKTLAKDSSKQQQPLEDSMEVSEKVDEEEKTRVELMEKLLKERPKTYYEYQLKGIIVHRGSSESGHYYSYIQERVPGASTATPQWIEFNDKIVRPFDIADLSDSCYGGVEEVMRFDEKSKTEKKITIEKSRNAYMLIYERVEFLSPERLDVVPKTPFNLEKQEKKKVNGLKIAATVCLFAGKLLARVKQRKDSAIVRVTMPDYLYDKVWGDNQFFSLEKLTFDSEYFNFLLQLLKSHVPVGNSEYESPSGQTPDNTLSLIQFATIFFIEIMSRAKDTLVLKDFTAYLCDLFSKHTKASVWLLEELLKLDSLLREVLFENTNGHTRKAFADLLIAAMTTVLPHEDQYFLYFTPPPEDEQQLLLQEQEQGGLTGGGGAPQASMEVEGECKFLVAKMLFKLANKMGYDDWKWTYLDEFFYLMYHVAQLSEEALGFLLVHRFVSVFHDVFSQEELANAKKLMKRTRMKRKGETTNFQYYMSLMSFMTNKHKSNPQTTLDEDELKMMLDKASLYKMIKNGFNNTLEILNFAALWCVDDLDMSLLFLEATLAAIKDSEFDSLKPSFEMFQGLLKIQDSLTSKRVSFAMEKYVAIMEEKKKLPKKTRECISFFFDVGKENEIAKKWLTTNKEKYSWVPSWLKENPIRK